MNTNQKLHATFVIGLEGSGHHALQRLIEPFLRHSKTVCRPRFNDGAVYAFEKPVRFLNRSFDTDLDSKKKRDYHRKAWNEIDILVSRKCVEYIYLDESFPYDKQNRNSKRRYDIRLTLEKLNEYSHPRILLLERNLYNCIYSAFRRGFCERIEEQIEVSLENLFYINESLASFPSSEVRKLDMELFCKSPELYVSNVCRWLRIPEEYTTIKNLHSMRPPSDIPFELAEKLRSRLDNIGLFPNQLDLCTGR